jgi:hypothetical protein
LLGERLPEVRIVVGDQNGADRGHQIFPRRASQRIRTGR